MLITKKMLLVLALAVAFVGAGLGALVTHSASNTTAANTTAANTTADANPMVNQSAKTPDQIAAENSTQFKTSEEQTAYRQGFEEGYQGCASAQNNSTSSRTLASNRAPVRRYSNGRAYYDYSSAPRGRSFWQKHRDKLTMAVGTGGGAALGGLIGGGKGAGIGALAGLGGSALYTYKLRHRQQRSY
ncbi:MAG TPA: hypothetical protein VLQ90_03565 [Pyrinomonadaceae bacterium]|nr:hypothetical protein [Pyrinomonadaceae bacterium]